MNAGTIARYVIFDLDGTLINVNSITHLIGDWEQFHMESLRCPPHEKMVEFARRMQCCCDLIISTGKPEAYYQRAVDYLSVLGIQPEAIIMRPALNTESDAQLKLRKLEEYLGADWRDQVLFAVDDRDKMVEAWRAAGVTCLQCAPSLY